MRIAASTLLSLQTNTAKRHPSGCEVTYNTMQLRLANLPGVN